MKKIDKRRIEDVLRLTPLQEGMLFHHLQDPASDRYFEQLVLEISAEIEPDSFEKAWNIVIETNEILRAVFRWEKIENPVQIILKKHRLQPKYIDLSGEKASNIKMDAEEILLKDRQEKFDLGEVPFRVTLCKIENRRYRMIISNHHILYDGWSNGIILKEFFAAYDGLCKGNHFLPPVKTGSKFKEFSQWLQNQDKERQAAFWRAYLKGFATPG